MYMTLYMSLYLYDMFSHCFQYAVSSICRWQSQPCGTADAPQNSRQANWGNADPPRSARQPNWSAADAPKSRHQLPAASCAPFDSKPLRAGGEKTHVNSHLSSSLQHGHFARLGAHTGPRARTNRMLPCECSSCRRGPDLHKDECAAFVGA